MQRLIVESLVAAQGQSRARQAQAASGALLLGIKPAGRITGAQPVRNVAIAAHKGVLYPGASPARHGSCYGSPEPKFPLRFAEVPRFGGVFCFGGQVWNWRVGDRWRAAAEVDSFPSPGRVSPVTGVARQCCTDCAGYRAFSGRVAKIVTLRHDDDFRDEFCSGTLWFTVLHPERCASPVPRLGLARTSRRCVGRVADLVSTVRP